MTAAEQTEPSTMGERACYPVNDDLAVHYWPVSDPPVGTPCCCGATCRMPARWAPGYRAFVRDVRDHGLPDTWTPNLRCAHRQHLGGTARDLRAAEARIARAERALWPGRSWPGQLL